MEHLLLIEGGIRFGVSDRETERHAVAKGVMIDGDQNVEETKNIQTG